MILSIAAPHHAGRQFNADIGNKRGKLSALILLLVIRELRRDFMQGIPPGDDAQTAGFQQFDEAMRLRQFLLGILEYGIGGVKFFGIRGRVVDGYGAVVGQLQVLLLLGFYNLMLN